MTEEPLTIFCRGAFTAVRDRLPTETELKAEHLLAYVLRFISNWKNFDAIEALIPAFILGKTLLIDLSLISSLAAFPQIESFTLEFLSAPNIPTFITLLYLELLKQLFLTCTEGGVFPPQSKLPGFLTLMLGDGRRRVASMVHTILSIVVAYEAYNIRDLNKKALRAEEQENEEDSSSLETDANKNTATAAGHSITPGYCSLQIVKSILSILSSEGTMNIIKMTLHNLRIRDASPSENQLYFLSNLIYSSSGGPAAYLKEESASNSKMSAGCMLIIRLLQLLFVPDAFSDVLHVIGDILITEESVDLSLLSLIDLSFRELPLDETVAGQALLVYENVVFYIIQRMQKNAVGPTTFQILEKIFDHYLVFLKQLQVFFRAGANPCLLQKSLSLISASTFSHRTVVAGHLLPAFEDAVNAIVATIDPVNTDSFFGKVGSGFSGIAEGCFQVDPDETPEYKEVIAGLKGFFSALVTAANQTENPICLSLILQFLKHLDLELAFQTFECGLINNSGSACLNDLVGKPAGATNLWLLSYYSKCKTASLAFIYNVLLDGVITQLECAKINTSLRSVLIDQLWTIISNVTRTPMIDDFLGYSQDTETATWGASTKHAIDMFCNSVVDSLFNSSESRVFHSCSITLGNLLRFFSTVQEDVIQLVSSISKTLPTAQCSKVGLESSSETTAYDSLNQLIANANELQLSQETVSNLRAMESSLSFAGKFLAPKLLTPLLDHLLTDNVFNYQFYLTLLPSAIAISTKSLTSTICSNVIKRIISGQGDQTVLFDVLSGIISGCLSAKNLSPLGSQTVAVFIELDSKLSATQNVSAQKLHYKLLRFLVTLSSNSNPELIKAILGAIEPAGNGTFRGGALQRHRFGLYADIVRSSSDFNIKITDVLSEFSRDIYLCISDNNMRVRHTASEMIRMATVKVCRRFCDDESLVFLKTNIHKAVQELVDCLQPASDSSLELFASYVYLLHVVMIGLTEVIRGLLITDLNILLEQKADINSLNCTHPFFINIARKILDLIRANLVLEKEYVVILNKETGVEETEFTYKYTLSIPTVTARRLLNFISAFVSAAGPSELLDMAKEISQVLLRLIIGTITSPHRSVVKNTLFQLGLAMGYSYSKELYEDALTEISKEMMDYIIAHSETPIVNVDSEILVAVREAGTDACISARRMISAVLSKLRHKASDQMIGRFTLPNYMDVALSIPEDMRSRMRVYSDEDPDFSEVYKHIIDKSTTVVDLEDNDTRTQDSADPTGEAEDPFANNKKFGKSLNSAMAFLLDETVERDNLRPEHIRKLAQIKASDTILNRTLNEIKKIDQRKQYSSGKLKVVHTGHEFSSKRAGGDVRFADKMDPYAYLPLLTGKHIHKQDRKRLKAGMALVTQKRTRDERIAKKQMLSHAEKRAMLKHAQPLPKNRNQKHGRR